MDFICRRNKRFKKFGSDEKGKTYLYTHEHLILQHNSYLYYYA